MPARLPLHEDPIGFTMFWDRLVATAEEQVTALLRSAFSPILRDAQDVASGIFDVRGRMLCQPLTGTPGHINPLSSVVKNFLAEIPAETLEPGDVLITNDPWLTSGQLLDVSVGVPVFDGERLIAIVACTGHMVDIGGYGVGVGATDTFEEGVNIPIMRLRSRGAENETLTRLLRANVRDPRRLFGDLQAMVASCKVGGQKLLALMREYGLETLDEVADEILERSERAQREAIAALPDGAYEYGIELDGDEQPLRLQCKVVKEGSSIVVDFDGTSPQSARGINVVLNYTAGYATFAIRSALAPDVPNNDGSMAPITVLAPDGCIVNCTRPAPTTARHLVGMFVATPVLGALAQAVPDRVVAESASGVWGCEVRSLDDGVFSQAFISLPGGMGARPTKDGISAVSFPSVIACAPVEAWESSADCLIARKELRVGSGGAGRFRGGLGQTIEVGMRTGRPWLASLTTENVRSSPAGFRGGRPGASGRVWSSSGRELPHKGRVRVEADETVVLELPGGGGYGDPFERDPALVAADVREGLLERDAAAADYGVVLDAAGAVDVAATEARRAGAAADPGAVPAVRA